MAKKAAAKKSAAKKSATKKSAAKGEQDDKGATKTAKKPGKTAKAARTAKPGEGRTSPVTFYRQVVAELRKVVYPTQEQLVTYFIVVMVFVLVMMGIVAGLDLGFGKLAFAIFTGGEDI